MNTPLSREKLQNHIAYSWWKYALLAIISVMAWSIIFSMTAYRPPEEKQVILGIYGIGDEAITDAYVSQVHAEHFPDMELMDATYILPDDMYGDMVLSTRIAARDCDLYVLPRSQFQNYASQGGFMPLDVVLPDLVAELEAAGVSLSRGWRTVTETGEKHLYGIPCQDLPSVAGTAVLGYDTKDAYISIFFETGNDDTCIRFFEQLIRDMMLEPVEVDLAQ